MDVLTKIAITRRNPHRRSIYLNNKFAFACSVNVVARFRLREGMTVTGEQLRAIDQGELKQKCMDRALRYVGARLHSRSELQRKLLRAEFRAELIEQVLDELAKLGYVDDGRFARARATLGLRRKHHGRRRAMMDLRQRGVSQQVVEKVLRETYDPSAELTAALRLADKRAAGLRRLDPIVARRRLAGLLSRRGFDHQQISTVIDRVLGPQRDLVGEST